MSTDTAPTPPPAGSVPPTVAASTPSTPPSSMTPPLDAPAIKADDAAHPAGEEAPAERVHAISFWQKPWVQNALPFATSLILHVALITIGYATFKTVQKVYNTVTQDQVIVPDAVLAENGPPGGIVNPGANGDPSRAMAQNAIEDVQTSQGWAAKKGEALQANLTDKGSEDSTIGIGSNSSFGKSNSSAMGMGGNGGDSGALAPFGTPGGGGGIGPKAPFAGVGGNATKIVYLCDASGSMNLVFPALKDELRKSISGLSPIQFFNVIFFPEGEPLVFNQGGLGIANVDRKKKLFDFMEDINAHGQTHPDDVIKAFKIAFDNKPQLIYVLTDGFDTTSAEDAAQEIADLITKLNADHKVKINAILLYNSNSQDKHLTEVLQKISKDNGGVFKAIDRDKF